MFDLLSQKINNLFSSIKGTGSLTVQDVQKVCAQMSDILIDADIPLKVVREFIAQVEKEAILLPNVKGKGIKVDEQILLLMYKKIVSFLGGESENKKLALAFPAVVMVAGVQGSGKTTTIAKLAHYFSKKNNDTNQKNKILVASIDFYRPAAIEQLKIMADKAQVAFYASQSSDPVKAAQEIYDYYKKGSYDVLLLDTAGRLHIDGRMIEELKQVKAVICPQRILLVLDAMTGQESLTIAQTFDQQLSFDGAILTKMDSDTRGGAAFSFRYAIGKPIFFVGYGEKIDDLQPFYPERIAQRMIGMGDLETLSERVQAAQLPKDDAQEKRLLAGEFTLNDFMQQIEMMSKVGSFTQFAQHIPGMGRVPQAELEKMERQIMQQKAIISSMTPKERQNERILNESRKKRIARGAGVTLKEVDALLKYFEESRRYAKMMKKQGFLKQLFQ